MFRKNKSNKKFISLSGPSCSGKTTLVEAVNWSDYFKNYHLVESHTRALKSKGMQINEKGSDETQVAVWIFIIVIMLSLILKVILKLL